VTGCFLMARAVVALMLEQGGGRIVTPPEARERLLDPAIMGPPIVWLASPAAAGIHDQRIVAAEFEQWLAAR
jgi:hypothetical protein